MTKLTIKKIINCVLFGRVTNHYIFPSFVGVQKESFMRDAVELILF